MSVDDVPNWAHAQDLERGDVLPEVAAATRIAKMLGRYITPGEFSEASLQSLAGRVVAHRHVLVPLFEQVDADPARLGPKGIQLRQQPVSEQSDEDFFLGEAAYHKAGYEHAMAALAGMQSVYARSLADPDERGADEDDRRISQERADDDARGGAPRLTA